MRLGTFVETMASPREAIPPAICHKKNNFGRVNGHDAWMKDLPLFYAPQLREEQQLPEAEALHAIRALRTSVGDELLVTDGRGTLYETVVTAVDRRHCLLSITREEAWHKYWLAHWSIAVAPTRNIDRIEWMIEKMVEVGVDEIILLRTKHSERKHVHTERLERIVQSAMKQSQKALLPTLRTDVSAAELFAEARQSVRLIAHCREGISPDRVTIDRAFIPQQDVLIAIGPEGDFTTEEIEEALRTGFVPITLGESRLRTETAGLIALQWLHTLSMLHPPCD